MTDYQCSLRECENTAMRLINTQYAFCGPHFEELFVGTVAPGSKTVWLCEQIQD